MCFDNCSCCGPKPPGFDRGPTDAEEAAPADKRPWTEYDGKGSKQKRPAFKGCLCKACLLVGPTCCVGECQWCKCCGDDADDCCDVCCRCQLGRMKCCLFCGPQCNTPFCANCCDCCEDPHSENKITIQECCECDCCDRCCATRFVGCQLMCCHCTCVRCMPCCMCNCPGASPCSGMYCLCPCGGEEQEYMDGDLKPLEVTISGPAGEAMKRL
jgi:hypothetical protein